ncbi:hypothetical protein [Limosilactobacillus fermentum]|uniref:hypothetical protein n=1 Tax=Limosilactobacillus fermentum TaxID=1613 RepID=UPI003B984860
MIFGSQATDFSQWWLTSVRLPGEGSQIRYQKAMEDGIEVATEIYDYLRSDTVHLDMYDGKGAFA